MSEDLSSQDGLLQPLRVPRDGSRTPVQASSGVSHRAPASYFPQSIGGPGSFNADPKATILPRNDASKVDLGSIANWPLAQRDEKEFQIASEQRQAEYRDKIERETKIKAGSENLLEALNAKNPKHSREQRARVESELEISNRKIAQLRHELHEEIERSKEVPPPMPSRLSQLFGDPSAQAFPRPSHDSFEESEDETESPSYALAELLQALEVDSMSSDYYVDRANGLVELFRRHPTLKYDLVWDIFGVRAQVLLLSDSREVVAAGFRLMRYAITDRKSLQIMRSFHTDQMVILSLVKDGKVSVEREQALKFVRAFLDVKDGVAEISRSIARTIVAVAESHEDRMRNICVLTLAELFIRSPELAISAGAMGVLADALAEGTYHPSDNIASVFIYLLDSPEGRKHLRSGHELGTALSTFTDGSTPVGEDMLKSSAKVLAALLKSWSGLMVLSMNNFLPLRSLSTSLYMSSSETRDMVLELVLDVLRIKPPSWSSSFLAGRRLTTYGRVANTQEAARPAKGTDESRQELVEHYVAIALAALIQSGLLEALMFVIREESNAAVRRKATLLISELLNMAAQMLPSAWAAKMQVLPELFQTASNLRDDERHVATSAIYQIDSVNRTLHRTGQKPFSHGFEDITSGLNAASIRRQSDLNRDQFTPQIDDASFRAIVLDTQVITHKNPLKWKWDLIEKIVEGPLLNPKRLDEAIKASKFMKRLMGFYRPFKYRFSDMRNTKPNQRYVRVGCMLMKTLLSTKDGRSYLADNKLLRQVSECLAQVDRLSGLTSNAPLFSPDRIQDTLSGGYFALLGAISSNPHGLILIDRFRMANMFYHIVESEDRDDLIRCLLGNMDFTIDGHLRVILSKALTACSDSVRVYSTRLLRKYAVWSGENKDRACIEWAIDLLITQLYDPHVEVCEMAIKILEESCNDAISLEYVVQCRPALDHLGETGAPLLLRFLSTSIGYHYLDDLDYISQEMDDWFLGRNDAYVLQVEASLAQAFHSSERAATKSDEAGELQVHGQAPPHFYRELARTAEGCRLLERKGHFEEFVSIIREDGLRHGSRAEMLKVKGCLWAVGNVGSMELGGPFLESSGVVPLVVRIAEESAVMSMRGTAIFVLGLMSRSISGQELLAEAGWDVSVGELGQSTGICVPSNFGRVFSMAAWPGPPSGSRVEETVREREEVTDADPVNARILELVNDLGNTVLSKARASELQRIKARRVEGFRSPALFHKVMKMLDRHHVRLPVLRFVMDLFEREVMKRIMFEDSDSGDDFDTTLRPE